MRTWLLLAAAAALLAGCHRQRESPKREECTPSWAKFRHSSLFPKEATIGWISGAGILSAVGNGAITQGPTTGDFEVETTVSALDGDRAMFDLLAGNSTHFASAGVSRGEGLVALSVNTNRVNLDGSLPATLRLQRRGHRITSTASGGSATVTETVDIDEDSVYVILESIRAPQVARLEPFIVASGADLCTDRFRSPLVLRGEVVLRSVFDTDAWPH